jgi:hypothetical protein
LNHNVAPHYDSFTVRSPTQGLYNLFSQKANKSSRKHKWEGAKPLSGSGVHSLILLLPIILYIFSPKMQVEECHLVSWLLEKDKYGTIDSAIWACAVEPGELEGIPSGLLLPS